MKSCLQNHHIEMHSTHNEKKSVVAEGFIRTIKNKIYKYLTSVSKSVYIEKLTYVVNEQNNTNLSAITMKPLDVKSSTYTDFNEENNKVIINLKLVNLEPFLEKFTF